MSRGTTGRTTCGPNVTSSRQVAIAALAVCMLSMIPMAARAAAPGLVLWNKLGSPSEVLNSAHGPNLGFFDTTGEPDITGNPAFVPGVFGNGVSIGPPIEPGVYNAGDREHTVVWSGVDQYLNPERGTISMWYKQNSDPVSFDHGVYRLFDGAYGLGAGVGLWSQASFPDPDPSLLYFDLSFYGPDAYVTYNISPSNGNWIHVAGVWDRNGIDNTADTIRLYIDGNVVASTNHTLWGTTVGPLADIAGGNDQNIAGQFAVDNLKVYNVAVTNFSDRFVEGVPEPGSACLALVAMVFLATRRTKRG